MIRIGFIGFILMSVVGHTSNVCRNDYFETKETERLSKEVREDIDSLSPVVLDVSNPKESLQRLIQEIRALHPEFAELSALEQLIESGQVSPHVAQSMLLQYRQKAIERAQELLDKNQIQRLTQQERKILEGYKILLNRMERLHEKAEEAIREEQEQQADKQEQKENDHDQGRGAEEKSEEQKNSDPSEKQESDRQQSSQDKNQQEQSRQNQEQQQSQQNQDKQEQSQSQKSEQQRPQQQTKEQLEKQIEDLKKQIQEKIKEQQEQNQQNKEKQKQDSEEQGKEPQEKQEGQEGKPEEGKQEGEPQQGEGQKGEPQQGQGQGQDGKPQQGEPQQGQGQKGQPSNQKGESSSESSSQEGSPSNSSSQGKEMPKSVGDKLAEYFKNLLENSSKEKSEAEGEGSPKDSQNSEQNSTEKNKENSSQTNSREQRQKDLEEARERRRQEAERRQAAENRRNQNKTNNNNMSNVTAQLAEMNQLQKSEFLKSYVDQLWAEALRNYTDHGKLMVSLGHFRSVADALASQYSEFPFLMQYSARAQKVFEELDSSQIHYKDLDHLSLSIVADEAANTTRKLRFIITVLENLKEVSPLSLEEGSALERAYEVLASRNTSTQEYERELGKAFYSQMLGPLSKLDIKQKYPSADPREELDWVRLAQDIKAGVLNDLIGFSRMKSYLNMFNRRTFKPKHQRTYTGEKVPINEAEPKLDTADDLDRAPYFHRDGTHPQEDLLRLISGDMLENIYPDQRQRPNPKQKIPKVVTIVVFDVSGSMAGEKDQIRNALISAYIDKTQVDTVTGRADHVYYFIPFAGQPYAAERVGDFAQAREYFSRFRQYPRSTGSDTNITDTLVSVYESIARHQREGGELDYANILFITDGEAPLRMPEITAARNKVNPEVDIILNAITLGGKNEVVDTLVRENGGTEGNVLGKVFHQHLLPEQMTRLLNHTEKLEHLEKIAQDFSSAEGQFNRDILFKLKNEIAKLAVHREYKDRGDSAAATRVIRELEKSRAQTAPDPVLDFPITVFLSTVDGAISEGWSLGRRGEALNQYLEKLSEIYKINTNDIILKIDESLKQKLILWLNKN